MLNKIHYDKCVCCGSSAISYRVSAVDHTVSKESFEIWECSNCTFRFTQDVPDAFHIGPYYQSPDYVSHSDTKDGLINRLYHFAKTITLKSKSNIVKMVTEMRQGSLLDYGAGTGAFLNYMNQAGWNVKGLEPDDIAKANARKNYNLKLQDVGELKKFSASSMDAITLWHVLEHVHELHSTLDSFEKILKSSGKLIIAVPNYTSYDAQYYNEHWAAYDVPRHLYHFSPKAMKLLLDQKGFALEKVYPMWFDSIYVSMLSEKYKHGKNNYLRAFTTGLTSNLKALFNIEKCSSVIYIAKKKFSD